MTDVSKVTDVTNAVSGTGGEFEKTESGKEQCGKTEFGKGKTAGIGEKEWRAALEEKQGAELCRLFAGAHVAICGAGGLGSNIAVTLARAGVGHLHIIDFDKVEITNLNRQQYFTDQIGMTKVFALEENLKRIAPYCDIKAECMKISADNIHGLFDEEPIICEAFDKAEAKAMLAECVMQEYPDRVIVSGSGMAGIGHANEMKTRRVTEHLYICGDEKSDVDAEECLLGSRVAICAAHQAHTVLRLIAGLC